MDIHYIDTTTAEYRENVSYAVGEPLGMFSYIPHTVFSDGSVWLSKEAIQTLWDYHHPNWYNVEMEKQNET